MTNVIKLAKQIHLIDNSGACAFVAGTNLIPYIERFAKLVRNAALEEARQKVLDFQAGWIPDGFIECAAAIESLKEPTP